MRIKPVLKNGGMFLLTASTIYGVHEYITDFNNAQEIKSELSNYRSIPTDPYDTKVRILQAEYKEPMFNKTAYWEVEAQKIRAQVDKKIASYENIHAKIPTAKNLREMRINDLAKSFELKVFLRNDSIARDEHLLANPSLKLVSTKNYNLDETFPTDNLQDLKLYVNLDTDWIPQKKDGYVIRKEQKKIKVGNKEKIKTIRVKEPKFKPIYKDVQGFFEPEVKEENGVKYLVCNYYGHDNK